MPADDLYLPVLVGKAIHPDAFPGIQGDNEGINISIKNPNYNELTAIYWAWKNLNEDVIGIVHYRRYFSTKRHCKSLDDILKKAELQKLMETHDVIVPKMRHYYIESNWSHYVHAHESEPLVALSEVIRSKFSNYAGAYEHVIKDNKAHMFNMFVMRKKLFDEYCSFMFGVLAEVEKKIDISTYTTQEKRVYGFLSEILMDVWLKKHTEYNYCELYVYNVEGERLLLKGSKFLLRKFGLRNEGHIGS